MPKPQILFVDDESSVLTALRRSMWPRREEWDLHWSASGAEAIQCLATTPMDIVVTDMRMPGMDGAALLEEVRISHPGVVRIVLSGHADHATIIDAAGPTQQFLAKPCDAETIATTIETAVSTLELLHSPLLRELLGSQVSLPKPSDMYSALTALVAEPHVTVSAVAQLIEGDVASSTEVLKLVNSSFFGLGRQVTTIERAITLLGLDVITALVLAGQMFRPAGVVPAGLDPRALTERGVLACLAVRRIGERERWPAPTVGQLGLAALLHDVALLVLAAADPSAWQRYCQPRGGSTQRAHEMAAFGCTVGRASAYLLGLWGFHETLVTTLAEQPVGLEDLDCRRGASPAALAVAFARLEGPDCVGALLAHLAEHPSEGYLTADRAEAWAQWTRPGSPGGETTAGAALERGANAHA